MLQLGKWVSIIGYVWPYQLKHKHDSENASVSLIVDLGQKKGV